MPTLAGILLILVFILLNAFFVASEFALVSVRRTRMQELANKRKGRAKKVLRALDDLDTYISATQLGITIASIALGWIGEPILADMFVPLFSWLHMPLSAIAAHTMSIGIAFAIITFLHIVLGELTPKSLALQETDRTALFVITPLRYFALVFKPIIWLLNTAGIYILKILGLSGEIKHPLHSEEEIRMILDQSGEGGVLAQNEVEMVHNVFQLGDIPVKQIMMPRTAVVAFPLQATLGEVIRKIKQHSHSRYPVYDGSVDTIVGFVHVKDIYRLALKTDLKKKLEDLHCIRKTIAVPETKKADEVLRDMRRAQVHMIVVSDEYGGTAGVASLEDILERLVGEIGDEFDRPAKEIQRENDGYLINGLVSLEKIQRRLAVPLRGQGYATIGGLMFGLLGREPKTGDKVVIGDLTLEVASLYGKRISSVRLTPTRRRKK